MKKITIRLFGVMMLLVLPVNILGIMLSNHVLTIMRDKVVLSVESVLQNQMTVLENRMNIGRYLVWSMRYDSSAEAQMMRRIGTSAYSGIRMQFYNEFRDMSKFSDGLDSYFFLVKEQNDLMLWNVEAKDRKSAVKFIQKEQEMQDQVKGWILREMNGREILCLYAEWDKAVFGGWIYLDTIQEQLEKDILYEKDYIIFSDKPGEEMSGYYKVTRGSSNGKIYMNTFLDAAEIENEIVDTNLFFLIGTGTTLLLFPILYLLIRKWLLIPLQRMNTALIAVASGNLDYRIVETANSQEYEQAFQLFNMMTEQVRELKIANYEQELERKELELENLQLQIRPHFLLNTFSLMYTLAQKRENSAIQDIILYLSGYFRYIFRSGKNLELFSKEQELIEAYMKMVRVRYPNCVEIEYSYDPEIAFVRVPPLLLHNFVENIIDHVVKMGVVTHISIVGRYESETVSFMIMDDGQGMSPERTEEVSERMRKKSADGSHIGFHNSLKRIRLFYGPDADIQITSEENEGTCITVIFPYSLEAADDSFDSK